MSHSQKTLSCGHETLSYGPKTMSYGHMTLSYIRRPSRRAGMKNRYVKPSTGRPLTPTSMLDSNKMLWPWAANPNQQPWTVDFSFLQWFRRPFFLRGGGGPRTILYELANSQAGGHPGGHLQGVGRQSNSYPSLSSFLESKSFPKWLSNRLKIDLRLDGRVRIRRFRNFISNSLELWSTWYENFIFILIFRVFFICSSSRTSVYFSMRAARNY